MLETANTECRTEAFKSALRNETEGSRNAAAMDLKFQKCVM
jgi:hypothetical protein